MQMRPFGRLITASVARRRLLSAVHPVEAKERIPLARALGRVSALAYRARFPVPSFARATWDGYAFAAASVAGASGLEPVSLRLVGEVFAEGAFGRRVKAGETVAIATGAPLPEGTDTVLIFEEAHVKGDLVAVDRPVRVGERVADAGDDFAVGDVVVERGSVLTPAGLGGLAATGTVEVEVRKRPRVSIIPNGNELLLPGEPRRPGRIYETNNLTLSAVVEAAGGLPSAIRPIPDDPQLIEAAIRQALAKSDMVLVTGGSSVGERDFLPSVFPKIGRLLFHGIAIRPGKPTLAISAGRKVVIGMPGHPTSCLSNGFWLLLPALRRLSGLPGPGWMEGEARMAEPYPVNRSEFSTVVPLRVDAGRARPTFRDSSAITSLSGTNAFVILPASSQGLALGQTVPVHFLLPPLALPPMPPPR